MAGLRVELGLNPLHLDGGVDEGLDLFLREGRRLHRLLLLRHRLRRRQEQQRGREAGENQGRTGASHERSPRLPLRVFMDVTDRP